MYQPVIKDVVQTVMIMVLDSVYVLLDSIEKITHVFQVKHAHHQVLEMLTDNVFVIKVLQNMETIVQNAQLVLFLIQLHKNASIFVDKMVLTTINKINASV